MHHVLASNAASATFPKNHASAFSTPVAQAYTFYKPWEVALTNLTHSNCIYTFNKESLYVTDSEVDSLSHIRSHHRIPLTFATEPYSMKGLYLSLLNQISKHDLLKQVLFVDKLGYSFFRWKIRDPDFFIIISDSLCQAFQLQSTVITHHDNWPYNEYSYKPDRQVQIKDAFITIVRAKGYSYKFTIKEENSSMTLNDMCNTFNRQLHSFFTVKKDQHNIIITRVEDDNTFIILSRAFYNVFSLRQASIRRSKLSVPARVSSDSFTDPWEVYLYRLNPEDALSDRYILPPRQFITHKEACDFLSDFDSRVAFTCDAQAIVTMEIKKKGVQVYLDNTLRDILALDRNLYVGKGKFVASATLSLVRRIQYLYIYSNISAYIRVGDTEAPLLAVIPFNALQCDRYRERLFKQPMYSPIICDHITQIDVEIRDDAGQLVPFHSDALTTMRLHFRPRQMQAKETL